MRLMYLYREFVHTGKSLSTVLSNISTCIYLLGQRCNLLRTCCQLLHFSSHPDKLKRVYLSKGAL